MKLWPLLVAAALALPVALVASSIDDRYEATASARIQPAIPPSEIDRLRATAGLPRLDDPATPFLPRGRDVLEDIVRRSARRLAMEPPSTDGLRVIDTEEELVFPKYKEPERRLKVKAQAGDDVAAARLANVVLRDYLDERERRLAAALRATRRRLLDASNPRLRGAPRPLVREAAEAVDITIALQSGLSVARVQRARAPAEPILPNVARDTIVAALIGALLGWLAAHARRTRQTTPAREAASAS